MEPAKERKSGMTAASEEAKAEVEKIEEPMDIVLPEDKPRSSHHTPAFSRVRVDWSPDDRMVIDRTRDVVESRINSTFIGAFEVMAEIYDIVREPQLDENGDPVLDRSGWVMWQRNAYGGYVEDFTRLTTKQKEHLLFKITTRIFEWEQAAADAWGEAMMAKASFEEHFAIGFDSASKGTVDARRAQGNLEAREERYFAIFMSTYSRKADSIVRSMTLLGQRLRDTLE